MSCRSLCISLHDVAPATWPACQRLLQMLDGLGVSPVTLLVVPDYHSSGTVAQAPEFRRAIEQRLKVGDEIALHGYFHWDDSQPPRQPVEWFKRRVLTAAEAEFAALDLRLARARLQAGLDMLQALGWPVHGFVAPAWQLGAAARAALTELPFVYTTTRTDIWRLPQWQAFRSPSLVYSVRSCARRRLSLHWNDFLARRLSDSSLLRVSLHPVDAAYSHVLAHWGDLISQAAQQRQTITKYAWVMAQP